MILDDHREVAGVNIGQLGTIAIATTHDALLCVIIVGAREKVTKDKFGVPKTLFFVHTNTNTTEGSIILDSH